MAAEFRLICTMIRWPLWGRDGMQSRQLLGTTLGFVNIHINEPIIAS
jgi:hypothetical protein